MKKITIVLLFLSLGLSLYSQGLRFSFMANPQLNWLTADNADIESDGTSFGLNTGIEMDWFFAERYAFSTGLYINNSGGRIMYSDSLGFDTGDDVVTIPGGNSILYKLQYISVPIGLKFKTIEIGYATYWVNVGITPMINIRARATDTDDLLKNSDVSEEMSGINMNYFIEAGMEYSLGGNTALVAGLGYYPGFMDVTNRSADKITGSSVSLVIGVLF